MISSLVDQNQPPKISIDSFFWKNSNSAQTLHGEIIRNKIPKLNEVETLSEFNEFRPRFIPVFPLKIISTHLIRDITNILIKILSRSAGPSYALNFKLHP